MSLFRPLLKESWRLIWIRPWTILFGFMASFWGAGGFRDVFLNAENTRETATNVVLTLTDAIRTGRALTYPWSILEGAWRSPLATLASVAVISIACAIIVCLFWVSSVTQGGLIDTTRKQHRSLRTTMRAAWMVGHRYGWRVFGMHVAVNVTFGIFVLIIGGLGALSIDSWMNVVFSTIGLIGIIFGALVMTLTAMYAANAIVLRDYNIWEGIRFSLKLFSTHWLVSLEMAIIFFVLQILFGIIGILVSSIVTLPFLFLFLIAQSTTLPFPFSSVLSVWMMLTIAILAFLTATLSVWQTISWSTLFFELTENENGNPRSALLRLFHNIRSYGK